MARAVRFDRYGALEVLYIAEVEVPSPSNGEVLVEVRAAGGCDQRTDRRHLST
jgi:NADPH:quinone reductase-like Zn-dependent oxidoreductase